MILRGTCKSKTGEGVESKKMNNQKLKPILHSAINFTLFTFLFTAVVVLVGRFVFTIAPNTNSLFGVFLSFICALPLAFSLFFNPKFIAKVRPYQRFLLPSLIFPLCILLSLGLNLYQQTPKNLFKLFVMDPIPDGVSNIRGHDISGGFDGEILLAFDVTPSAVEKIINEHELKIYENPYSSIKSQIAIEYFPEINFEQEWTLYQKAELENINWWNLWVNTDQTIAIFQIIDG